MGGPRQDDRIGQTDSSHTVSGVRAEYNQDRDDCDGYAREKVGLIADPAPL